MNAERTSFQQGTAAASGRHVPAQGSEYGSDPTLRDSAPVLPMPRDLPLLRVGAVAAVLGIVVQVAMTFLHPSHAAPNDSAAAFAEYSHSDIWVVVHIGQFFGTLLIVVTLVAISRAVSRQPGTAGALGVIGGVTAVLVGAVFAVQMAVDGVALKGAIDTWAHAAAADKSAAFLVADGVRWIEKALSSFFHLLNGTTLLALGLAVAFGRTFPRWLGWVGALSGTAFVIGGVIVSRTGFSPQAQPFLLPALALSAVFLIGIAVSTWRTPRRTT
jgi:hypothetical protein